MNRETIKLTAQFVARNGQKFLTGLTERESKNPQFDFLKPTHILFNYFTSLVDAYSRCLVPKKDELIKLQRYVDDPATILEQGLDRYEYQKSKMQAERKAKDEKAKEEELEVMQIDWHDFVTVETINFDDDEKAAGQMPGQGIAGGDKIKKEVDTEAMEMDMDNEESRALAAAAKKVEAEKVERVEEEAKARERIENARRVEQEGDLEPGAKIKTDYERKFEEQNKGKQKCPKCGAFIPKEEFDRHLKIELISPGYFAQRKDILDKAEGRTMATGDEVVSNLQEFGKQRPDLFGSVEEQLPGPKKEEKSMPPIS